MSIPTCVDCHIPMVLKYSRFYRHSFYGCPNWPDCKCTIGIHPNGKPVGIPANAETRKARTKTHQIFDNLWKSGRMKRKNAYRLLAVLMDVDMGDAHIGHFTLVQCEILQERLANWQAGGDGASHHKGDPTSKFYHLSVGDPRVDPTSKFYHLFTGDLHRILMALRAGIEIEPAATEEEVASEIARREKLKRQTGGVSKARKKSRKVR